MTMRTITVGNTNIKKLMSTLKLSQMRLARLSGISRPKLNMFLNENYSFTADEVARLDQILSGLAAEHVRELKGACGESVLLDYAGRSVA